MYFYYNSLREQYRKYKTPGKLIQRLRIDFPDDGTCEHTFYKEEEVEPNMRWVWTKVPRPSTEDVRMLRYSGGSIKRKVFYCPYMFEGWQTTGNDIRIWWSNEEVC